MACPPCPARRVQIARSLTPRLLLQSSLQAKLFSFMRTRLMGYDNKKNDPLASFMSQNRCKLL